MANMRIDGVDKFGDQVALMTRRIHESLVASTAFSMACSSAQDSKDWVYSRAYRERAEQDEIRAVNIARIESAISWRAARGELALDLSTPTAKHKRAIALKGF